MSIDLSELSALEIFFIYSALAGVVWFVSLALVVRRAKSIKDVGFDDVILTWVCGLCWPLLLIGGIVYFFFKYLIIWLWGILHQNEDVSRKKSLGEYK